ncbi:ABC transporter ATP-binding protein [Kutzneria viridogrisea]|uniref:ATP-binding cassette subfamily B protein n=1 Tax=Kutzneria viridogrisea TaxID=47990 RepID=A0ABR6BTS6_9PSEU|nr:ATP-binding cassette subfamily B protein [Kutzneria viridogrisea]
MLRSRGDRLLLTAALRPRGWLAAMALISAAGTAASLLLPDAMAAGVDAALSGTGDGASALLFAGTALVLVGTESLTGIAVTKCVAASTTWLRHKLIDALLALRPADRERFAAGDAVSRMVNDPVETGSAGVLMVQFAASTLLSAGAVVALALLHWTLAVVFAVSMPLAVFVARAYLRNTAQQVTAYRTAAAELSARFLEAVLGLRTITATRTAEREVRRVLRPLPGLGEAGAALWSSQATMVWNSALLGPGVEIVVLAAAGVGVVNGQLTVGQALAALGYAAMGMGLTQYAPQLMTVARARASAERLSEVLAVPSPEPGGRPLPDGPGVLALQGVSAGPLEGVDLLLPAGQVIAVVGRSGTGKSTLAALAAGLAEPTAGVVTLDGVPLRELRPEGLRGAVGFAFERPVLLGGTVGEAIGYGRAADERAIRAAGRAAQVDDAILRLPEGYDTPLAEAPMSGGEAQRVGLARALVGSPRVLVLDDATSSVDTVTEVRLATAITDSLPGRTRLVVTHRSTTAARADLVVWLADGSVRATGAHELLWQDPEYRAVFAEA